MSMRIQRRRLARNPARTERASFMSVEFPFPNQRFFKLIGRQIFPARFGEMEFGKSVASTTIGGVRVSTVFLGLAQPDFRVFLGEPEQPPSDALPVLFETMVFDDEGPSSLMERYRTFDEAEAGHARYCNLIQELDGAPLND